MNFIINICVSFYKFILDLWRGRHLIIQLTRRDFVVRYLGSYIGLTWAFIHPLATLSIIWFVFEVGFKAPPVQDLPFILWLSAGIIPWFFIAEAMLSATQSIFEHSYLVKKVVFRVSILPIVKILSTFIIHCFLILVLLALFTAYGYYPSIYCLQIPYYAFCAFTTLVGLGWLACSLAVFLRDVTQIVTISVQFGFWLTPIFWALTHVSPSYRFLFKLNPFYYVIKGYRESFIYHKWFWQSPELTLYFWFVTTCLFFLGALVFRKLRPHFADVL